MSMMTAAISSSASVLGLKPAVSTSTTTGRKPRKRRARRDFSIMSSTSFTASFLKAFSEWEQAHYDELLVRYSKRLVRYSKHLVRYSKYFPAYDRAGTQGDNGGRAELVFLRQGPVILDQCDAVGIAWQAIKVRAVVAGKAFQALQRAQLLEYFGIEFQCCRRGEAASAAAGGFFRATGVRGGIGAEEELGVAADGHIPQGLLMGVALEDGQAVEVRAHATGQHVIAVEHQVLDGQGGRHVG